MTARNPSWWDPYSDQPRKLVAASKRHTSASHLAEYSKTALCALGVSPLLAFKLLMPNKSQKKPEQKMEDFLGLGISDDRGNPNEIVDMVEDLGVQRLLLRVPTWDIAQIDKYLEFASKFPKKKILVNILQSRQSINDLDSWMVALETIIRAFRPITSEYQLGNAINRSKWGCRHVGDYLTLLDCTKHLRKTFPGVFLAGSSIIDFEPLATLRTLINMHQYRLDACTSLLYVNRRGSPYQRQFGMFDLKKKIRIIDELISISTKSDTRLWITETNWPLLNTQPFTPNSGHPRSTVNEQTQAKYLTDYYQIAWRTGRVERVYWWQLIQAGYGLVDHRANKLRKMPSYLAFKELCSSKDWVNQTL